MWTSVVGPVWSDEARSVFKLASGAGGGGAGEVLCENAEVCKHIRALLPDWEQEQEQLRLDESAAVADTATDIGDKTSETSGSGGASIFVFHGSNFDIYERILKKTLGILNYSLI